MKFLTGATINTEFGFAWASTDKDDNLFQVCLQDDGAIDAADTGWDWGLCGDWNHPLYTDDDDAKTALNEFLDLAEAQGITVTNR